MVFKNLTAGIPDSWYTTGSTVAQSTTIFQGDTKLHPFCLGLFYFNTFVKKLEKESSIFTSFWLNMYLMSNVTL